MAIFKLKICFIRSCSNINLNTKKIFISVPKDDRLANWLDISGFDLNPVNTQYFCCEDHFDLPKDAVNWENYCGGRAIRLELKKNVVPHRYLNAQNPNEGSVLTGPDRERRLRYINLSNNARKEVICDGSVETTASPSIRDPVPGTSHQDNPEKTVIQVLPNIEPKGRRLMYINYRRTTPSTFLKSPKLITSKANIKPVLGSANSFHNKPVNRMASLENQALLAVHNCIVPVCGNTTTNCAKRFLWIRCDDLNSNQTMQQWEDLLQVKIKPRFGPFFHCCEDHFNLETDIQDWESLKTNGGLLKLKQGVFPSKFLEYPKPNVISKISMALLHPSDSVNSSSERLGLPPDKEHILKKIIIRKRSLPTHAVAEASCFPTIPGCKEIPSIVTLTSPNEHIISTESEMRTDTLESSPFSTVNSSKNIRVKSLPLKNPHRFNVFSKASIMLSSNQISDQMLEPLQNKSPPLKNPHQTKATIKSYLPTISDSNEVPDQIIEPPQNGTDKTSSQDFCNIRVQIPINVSERDITKSGLEQTDIATEIRHQHDCYEDNFDLRKDTENWLNLNCRRTSPSTSKRKSFSIRAKSERNRRTGNAMDLANNCNVRVEWRVCSMLAGMADNFIYYQAVQVVSSCVVPVCGNTSANSVKHFLWIRCNPITGNGVLHEWEKLLQVEIKPSFGHFFHCCEDHFNLETDMLDWQSFKTRGGLLKLKQGVLPSKFLEFPNPDVISKISTAFHPSYSIKSLPNIHSPPLDKEHINVADKVSRMSCFPTIPGYKELTSLIEFNSQNGHIISSELENKNNKTNCPVNSSKNVCEKSLPLNKNAHRFNVFSKTSIMSCSKQNPNQDPEPLQKAGFEQSNIEVVTAKVQHKYSQWKMTSIHKSTSTEDLEFETDCDCDAHS